MNFLCIAKKYVILALILSIVIVFNNWVSTFDKYYLI